jgi:hypothetical protein
MLRADLVVLAPELPETRLVVEVKRGSFDRDEVVRQIKEYMVARRCPVALLVTPVDTWILRDTYEGYGEDAIKESTYSTAALLGIAQVPDEEDDLVRAVESWLERMISGSADALRDDLRSEVSGYLLPAVTEGRINSGSLG